VSSNLTPVLAAGDKVVSLRQPWAWLVVNGFKTVENRSWPTEHRGLIWIHASQAAEPQSVLDDYLGALLITPQAKKAVPKVSAMATGAIVGVASVDGCWHADELPRWMVQLVSASGPYCWYLSNTRPLIKPVPCKGGLKVWTYRR